MVGYGDDPREDECRLLQANINLHRINSGNGKTELAVQNEAELFAQCESVSVNVLLEQDKAAQAKTRAKCVELLNTCDLGNACAPYPDEFETVRDPVRSAFNVALASFRMPDEVELMVPWINYHGTRAVSSLNKLLNEGNCQRINEIKSNPDMMRSVTFFIDFGVDLNMIIDALRPLQPYGQEDWRDSGPMPQTKSEAVADVNVAAL